MTLVINIVVEYVLSIKCIMNSCERRLINAILAVYLVVKRRFISNVLLTEEYYKSFMASSGICTNITIY